MRIRTKYIAISLGRINCYGQERRHRNMYVHGQYWLWCCVYPCYHHHRLFFSCAVCQSGLRLKVIKTILFLLTNCSLCGQTLTSHHPPTPPSEESRQFITSPPSIQFKFNPFHQCLLIPPATATIKPNLANNSLSYTRCCFCWVPTTSRSDGLLWAHEEEVRKDEDDDDDDTKLVSWQNLKQKREWNWLHQFEHQQQRRAPSWAVVVCLRSGICSDRLCRPNSEKTDETED